MRQPLTPPTLDDIRDAAGRIGGLALRTPLIRLNAGDGAAEIYLKPENLQPIGSFKIRPALNVMCAHDPAALAQGVYTASSGNMAQGVAWAARMLGVDARVFVAEGQMSETKRAALDRLGAGITEVTFEQFWKLILDHEMAGEEGVFVHPVASPHVIAGNATIGLEIMADLPDVDTIVVPHGGGGLITGIAAAVRAVRPGVRVLSCECNEATPVAAALAAGHPVDIAPMNNFIAGISVGPVLDEMWPLIRELVDGAVAASVKEITAAIRLLFERNRMVAEGGGAAPVAAALAGRAGGGKIVCVISGGNLDARHMTTILEGGVP